MEMMKLQLQRNLENDYNDSPTQLDDLYFKSFCMTDGDRFRMGR